MTQRNLRHLSAGELASRWGISLQTMYRYIRQGRAPRFFRVGYSYQFAVDDVAEFEEANKEVHESRLPPEGFEADEG